ncbi:interferon gamma receptor 1 [Antennarius striatus]|uniref:interferon gamma receptor 1 n=1 Tax=Antennarius striatus TaxID=241820 RepID=UPI0035B02CDA
MLPVDVWFLVFVLISGVSSVSVLPPTKVNVSCANVHVTVSWEYGNHQPQTSFSIDVRGVVGQSVWRTTDHHFDLTPFIWTSENYYMDNFYVTVRAIQGENQSEPVKSKTFTFNHVKTTDIICKLDFPPVALKTMESGATVNFKNPFHYYKELQPALKPGTASLRFSVSTDGGDEDFGCALNEENCKHDITYPSECITLSGMLLDRIGVGQVLFRKTGRVCIPESTEVHILVPVILLSTVITLVIVAAVVICKVKTSIKKPQSPPTCLLPNPRKQGLRCDTLIDIDISAVQLVVSSKNHADSSVTEKNPTKRFWDSRAELYTGRQQAEFNNEKLEDLGLMAKGHWTDDNDDSVKPDSDCINLDKEEIQMSPYDCPHVPNTDMGDGEMIIAYGGR